MKAPLSPLAREILADPQARAQLRQFLGQPATAAQPRLPAPGVVIELRSGGRRLRLRPVILPKAG